MPKMCSRQTKQRSASMVKAAGMLMVGLMCSAFRVSARVNTLRSVAGPFHPGSFSVHHGSGSVTHFKRTGATEIMRTFVRVTPDEPDQVGALWSKYMLRSVDLSLEWKFRVGGSKQENYGGTFALVISPTQNEAGQGGRFFGIEESFTGLAIIVDTNQQLTPEGAKLESPASRRRDVAIVANNGTRTYDDLMANLDGCTADVKFGERKDDSELLQSSRIRLKVNDNKVTLDIDAGNKGWWRRCVTEAQVEMPAKWMQTSHIGVIAQTAERSSNQDLVRLQVYTDPSEAWNTNIYGEDTQEMDGVKQHAKLGRLPRRSRLTPMKHHTQPENEEDPVSIRQRRVLAKIALKAACWDSVQFRGCHQDRGSVLQLEECLQKRGNNISERCIEGIEAWKTLLIETASGARNMPPAFGKESAMDKESRRDVGSLHSHSVDNEAKENQQALLGGPYGGQSLVARSISNTNSDNKRTGKFHGVPTAPRWGDEITTLFLGKWLLGRQDNNGDDSGGRSGAPPPCHEEKKHAPHSAEPSRAHHRGRAVVGKKIDPSKLHLTDSDLSAIMSDPLVFDSSDSEEGFILVNGEDGLSLFVGYLSLALIVAFIVTRVVKTLAQHKNRHCRASGGDPPGGYQTLSEDDVEAVATLSVSGQQRESDVPAGIDSNNVDDDDAIVVTGTPVNPPPSAHL